jgi:hypothetical protein
MATAKEFSEGIGIPYERFCMLEKNFVELTYLDLTWDDLVKQLIGICGDSKIELVLIGIFLGRSMQQCICDQCSQEVPLNDPNLN